MILATGVGGDGAVQLFIDELDKILLAAKYADSLSTIPDFRYSKNALEAFADDLWRWCRGAILNGRVWSAENQAYWLVTEVREQWETWQGSAALRKVFGRVPKESYPRPWGQYAVLGVAVLAFIIIVIVIGAAAYFKLTAGKV